MTFRNPEIEKLFSDKYLVQKYLDVEIALAQVQANLVMTTIPQGRQDAPSWLKKLKRKLRDLQAYNSRSPERLGKYAN